MDNRRFCQGYSWTSVRICYCVYHRIVRNQSQSDVASTIALKPVFVNLHYYVTIAIRCPRRRPCMYAIAGRDVHVVKLNSHGRVFGKLGCVPSDCKSLSKCSITGGAVLTIILLSYIFVGVFCGKTEGRILSYVCSKTLWERAVGWWAAC